MYRFRNTESLLTKFQELEKQEIYFASPKELNDPLEGFINIFWKGDEILWRNFIINYTKSLFRACHLFFVIGESQPINIDDIKINQYLLIHISDSFKKLEEDIIATIMNTNDIQMFCKKLGERESSVKYLELEIYLFTIHIFIFGIVTEHLKGVSSRKGGNEADLLPDAALEQLVLLFNELEVNENLEKKFREIALNMLRADNLRGVNTNVFKVDSNSFFMLMEFPKAYLDKLSKSIFPNWYSASFLEEDTNSAVWSHYADNHRGVCLEFKPLLKDDKSYLKMKDYQERIQDIPFKRIDYSSKHTEVDFFRTIGRMTKVELDSLWYKDSFTGNMSRYCMILNTKEGQEEYIKRYWDYENNIPFIKLTEWAYEKEHRLIRTDFINESIDKVENRKFKYDFLDLKSITFGIKTSSMDKVHIKNIINKKCKEHDRKDFMFYQAYYDFNDNKIKKYELF